MGKDAKTFEVTVVGEPPIKRGPGGVSETRRRHKQQRSAAAQTLASAVQDRLHAMGFEPGLRFPWNPMTARIHLGIKMARGKCKADAANIIGGVADELQEVLYANDSHVREITYEESVAADGKDQYHLTVYEIGD